MSFRNGDMSLATRFMGSTETYNDAQIILVGVPMDFTCSFRPGTRFGPQKIREVSIGLEEYSLYQKKSLKDCKYYDSGDIDIPFGSIERSLKMIEQASEEIIKDGKFPLFIGGEHLISVPLIKKLYEKYGNDLIVLHFDAHADLRDEYIGCTNSHASAIRRIADFLPGKNIYQFGIRSGTSEEFEYARLHTNLFPFCVVEPLRGVVDKLGKRPVHITLDIDVLDPAYANGTGTPEPGGITSAEMLEALMLLKGLNIKGFDLVEVSPPYDHSDRTALLAAKLIREIIIMVG